MARPSYLKQVRPSGRWYFQRPIPPDVHPHLGVKSKLWSVSLHTDSESIAERAVIKHIADTDEIIRIVRLRADQSAVLSALPVSERRQIEQAGGVEGLLRETQNDITSSHYLRDSLGAVDITLDPRQVQHDQLDEIQTAAWLAGLDEVIAGKAAILHRFGWDVPNAPPPKAEIVGLAQVLSHYSAASQMPPQTEQQYAYAVRRFEELHGALAIDDLSRPHLREFADLIIGLPAAHKTAAASLLVRDAVKAASNAKMKTISYATVMKHVAALRTLTRHAEGAGLSSTDPFYGFRMPRPKTKGGNAKSRLPFTTQDISQIVAALRSAYRSDSADFWVPLIALYQGARLEEICQLEVTDVGVDQGTGVAFLRVTDEGAEGKKVKNKASVRQVPIHPDLLAMGFPEAVKGSRTKGNLFSELRADQRGRLGGPYGKRFSRFLRASVGIKDAGKVFHSFRHSWTDLARSAGIPLDVRSALAGREIRGSEAAYGTGHKLDVLQGYLSLVKPL